MVNTAILVTDSGDPASVVEALSVDNVSMDNLSVVSVALEGCIETRVMARDVRTLLSTLDDIVCCQITAEGLV